MKIVPDSLHEWRLEVKGFFNQKHMPNIKDVIFNDPATIVFWDDGTKTVVKAQGDDIFDPEKGLAMAITKKAFGNQGNYCEKIKPWLKEYEKVQTQLVEAVEKLRQIVEAVEKLRQITKRKRGSEELDN